MARGVFSAEEFSALADHAERLAEENERLQSALRACWDEYSELMPDGLYEQVKAALGLRVFNAAPLGSETKGAE